MEKLRDYNGERTLAFTEKGYFAIVLRYDSRFIQKVLHVFAG
jgi:hypothetical protein